MAIPRPSVSELVNRVYSRLQSSSSITAPLDSSWAGKLAKIIAAELDSMWAWVEERETAASPTTAIGADLDNWGILIGVPRKTAQQASTLGLTRSVRFTNVGASPIVVPTGLRVYKETDPRVAFFTTESATIGAGLSTEVHVSAVAVGEVYNVGIGELNRHSLPNVALVVTNILPISSGTSEESDASYRERILQGFRRRNVLNRDNVVALMRSYGGVKDVFLLDKNRGNGTFDVVVIPYIASDLSATVAECNRLLALNVPYGIDALAIGPVYRQIDITVNLRFDPTTGERQESIRESIRNQIKSSIDNLPVEDGSGNGSFYTGRIKAIATLSDPMVLEAMVSMGVDGSPISSDGELRLEIGERLLLRGLSIQ